MARTKVVSPHKNLSVAKVEKDVETAYRISFDSIFGSGCINSEFKTDGLLNHTEAYALMEFKHNIDLKKSSGVAQTLIQAIYYLHTLEVNGTPIPKVIFVGDIDECFCIPTTAIAKYLKWSVDWSISPSMAYKKNIEMYTAIANDSEVSPFVYEVTDRFDMLVVVEKMKAISMGKPYAVTITNKNIVDIYLRFQKDVVNDSKYVQKSGEDVLKSNVLPGMVDDKEQDLVDIFFTCLIDSPNCFIHPNKKGVLVAGEKSIKVNEQAYRGFFSQFRNNYTSQEKMNLTANKDRVLDDVSRRRTGAFFTPPIWAAEAHKMVGEVFGEGWREEYVVWDCAAGTANLTRDYQFKELYISTIEEHDIGIIEKMGYNRGAGVFHYDFLNDDEPDVLGKKVPVGLREAFEQGRKVLFLINPPYGTSANLTNISSEEDDHKAGIAKTKANEYMLSEDYGLSSRQLYAQFMYRILKLKQKYGNQVQLCLFAPPLFISGGSFEKFREVFYKGFNYKKGMLFQAGNFADVKEQWGISFTVWEGR